MAGTGKLIMLCGLPGSGKTHYAKSIEGASVFSSDELRKELFGDENEQGDDKQKQELFNELHKRIRKSLDNGEIAIYDATNLNKKRRMAFIHDLKNIECEKQCVILATPYEVCLSNNKNRSRVVPEDIIKRMYKNFQPPHKSEGWDSISIFYYQPFDYDGYLDQKCKAAYGFDQHNSHHTLSLEEHMLKTAEYLNQKYSDDPNLCIAGGLHDIGKPFTQSKVNKDGVEDGNYHYYQHHCVSAYDSLFHTYFDYGEFIGHPDNILDIANLVYYHMHPYISWDQSKKARNKDKELLGEKFYERVMRLHEADKLAH